MAGRAPVWVKWPNDVLAGDRRKLAGVLVEGQLRGEPGRKPGRGVGVNVRASAFSLKRSPGGRRRSRCSGARGSTGARSRRRSLRASERRSHGSRWTGWRASATISRGSTGCAGRMWRSGGCAGPRRGSTRRGGCWCEGKAGWSRSCRERWRWIEAQRGAADGAPPTCARRATGSASIVRPVWLRRRACRVLSEDRTHPGRSPRAPVQACRIDPTLDGSRGRVPPEVEHDALRLSAQAQIAQPSIRGSFATDPGSTWISRPEIGSER